MDTRLTSPEEGPDGETDTVNARRHQQGTVDSERQRHAVAGDPIPRDGQFDC